MTERPAEAAVEISERLTARIARFVRAEALIPDHARVLVALSGGADSVALTHLMQGLAPRLGFSLAGLVHVNHQLRREADRDEQFCRQLAERLALPIHVVTTDVGDLARRVRISIEEAGHRARYASFEAAAADLDAQRVATAHTLDDQAETYLMRLIRGAGPEGLAGIRPRSGTVIRPVLDTSRAELRRYLRVAGQSFREDETNQDRAITRNRIRHELIPFLERRFSPSVVDALARAATIARADAAWMDAAVNEIVPRLVSYKEEHVIVAAELLGRQPPALARRVARHVLEHVAGRTPGFDQVERFVALAHQPPGVIAEADFPGCRVEWIGDDIRVAPPRRRHTAPAMAFRYELGVPGRVVIPEAGLEITAQPGGWAPDVPLRAQGRVVAVASAELSSPLIVRSWQKGDILRPLGLGGRKKLQDLFVDRKVSRPARHVVPIVADKNKGIVWVVGHTVAEDFRVTAGTAGMLTLRAKKLGGAG